MILSYHLWNRINNLIKRKRNLDHYQNVTYLISLTGNNKAGKDFYLQLNPRC